MSWSYTFNYLTLGTSQATPNLPEIENLAHFFSNFRCKWLQKNLKAKYADTKKNKQRTRDHAGIQRPFENSLLGLAINT